MSWGARRLGFVVPALAGPISGGTLYNARLIAALRRRGVRCVCWQPRGSPRAAPPRRIFVDSLYLDAMPALRARFPRAALYLLLHYLPALVEHGRAVGPRALSDAERAALALADGFLVTSPFMRAQLSRLGAGRRPLLCVEPGVALPRAPAAARGGGPPRALMLCNLVPAKGVLPLLQALRDELRARDQFVLQIAGRLDLDPSHARACRALLRRDAALRARVRLLGALPQREALRLLRGAGALLSASRMESFGMALAEARAAGVPILARAGGHVAAQVRAAAGGQLVRDEAALARAWLALVREPGELTARRRRAQAAAGAAARSWDRAATELLAQLGRAR